MQGRKIKQESRADEFRHRLLAWKQAPESLRPSLRELARQLGTSHQLLEHYLNGLEEWKYQERYRQAKNASEEIRARAVAEGRPLTAGEEQQARTWDREAIRAFLLPGLLKRLEEIKQDAERGPLHRLQYKMLEIYAKEGFSAAQELLQKRKQIGVKKRKPFAEIVKETPRQQDEPAANWVRRIWDMCDKYETNCPEVLTSELLEELAGQPGKPEENLPPISLRKAKSFRSVNGESGNSAKVLGRKADAKL